MNRKNAMTPSPFDALIDDLIAVQERRNTQAPSRDAEARIARHAHEAARNRRMAQRLRPLRKSEPVPYRAPDWDGLAARQDAIAADLEQSRLQAQQDAIREHLSALQQAARAGRLTAHQACLLDVYRGQAAALGLQP